MKLRSKISQRKRAPRAHLTQEADFSWPAPPPPPSLHYELSGFARLRFAWLRHASQLPSHADGLGNLKSLE